MANIMQITDDNGIVYHPETNSDVVLYKGKSSTDTLLSTSSDIATAKQDLQAYDVAAATDRNTYPKIYVQDTRPQAMNDGDFWINTK